VKKVQFIREEVVNLEPKKLNLNKKVSLILSTITITPAEDEAIEEVVVKETEVVEIEKDVNAIEDKAATTKKKKKKGLRKQPTDSKDIYKYVKEIRNIVAAVNSLNRKNNWLLDTGSDKILTNRVVTLGYSEVIVRIALLGLDRKIYSFIITSYYTLGGYSKLFSIQKLLKEKGDILGYVDTLTGVLYLVSLKDKDKDDPNKDKTNVNSDNNKTGFRTSTVIPIFKVNQSSKFYDNLRLGKQPLEYREEYLSAIRVTDLNNRKLVVSRNIGFYQPGDNNNRRPISIDKVPIDLKDLDNNDILSESINNIRRDADSIESTIARESDKTCNKPVYYLVTAETNSENISVTIRSGYKKRDRDIQRVAIRVKAKDLGGNNLEEGRLTVKSNTRDKVYKFKDKNNGEIYTPVIAKYIIKIVFTLIAVDSLYKITDWLRIGFYPLDNNPYIYIKGKGVNLTIIIIYIDDFIIAVPIDKDIEDIVNKLRQFYDIKDLGKPKYIVYGLGGQ
ncbi:uncharacterized protein N7479_009709, partial [Penicillium vulpinum]|uniref:uncharacterized protein n=1 Tax=Penicillium vulpinum TaxID=29845 RepID=UPI002549168A